MTKEVKEVKEGPSLIDDIKRMERVAKAKVLSKKLSEIKTVMRNINENKYLIRIILKEVGVSDEESKKVIDFLNELPTVKLSNEDKDKIKGKTRESVRREVDKISDKVSDEFVFDKLNSLGYSSKDFFKGGSVKTTTTTNADYSNVYLSSADGSGLSIKL